MAPGYGGQVSSKIVIGPSSARSMLISAPNRPVATSMPSPRSAATTASTSGSATGPGAAACQVGPTPLAGVGVQRELADDEHRGAGVEHRLLARAGSAGWPPCGRWSRRRPARRRGSRPPAPPGPGRSIAPTTAPSTETGAAADALDDGAHGSARLDRVRREVDRLDPADRLGRDRGPRRRPAARRGPRLRPRRPAGRRRGPAAGPARRRRRSSARPRARRAGPRRRPPRRRPWRPDRARPLISRVTSRPVPPTYSG